jgi:phosphoglycolate phosphatase
LPPPLSESSALVALQVGAIKGSSQREPTVVGKPEGFMLADIAEKFGLKPQQLCMVGDRLDTDVLFGKKGGLTTLLVLSGVTTEEELLSARNTIHADYYTDTLSDLLSCSSVTLTQ